MFLRQAVFGHAMRILAQNAPTSSANLDGFSETANGGLWLERRRAAWLLDVRSVPRLGSVPEGR